MFKKETTQKKTKTSFIVITTIAIASVCFFVQHKISANSVDKPLVSVENGEIGQAGNEMLQLLLKLKSLSLDENIFEDEAFQSLKDFSLTLQEQPVGRNNPFAPVKHDEEYISDEVISDDMGASTDASIDL